MNKKQKFILIKFIITVICLTIPQIAFSEWKAGASSILITPTEPMWTAGYGGRKEPARSTISDLYIKALAVQDPYSNKAVIVTADLVGFPYEFPDKIASVIEKKWGISRDSIIFNASHTHCGPAIEDIPGIPEEYSARIVTYRNWLEEKFIELIDEALENLSPADVTFSTARPVPFTVSRRFPDGEGGVIYRTTPSAYYTGGPRDDISPVLKAATPDGDILAILFGYACHPITLSHNEFSGDYPGYAQQYVEDAFPGAVALFMQGTNGQLIPNSRFQIEYAMGHGRALADAVIRAVGESQTPLSGPIRTTYRKVPLNFEQLDRAGLEEQLAKGIPAAKPKAAELIAKMERGENIEYTFAFPFQAMSFGQELLLLGFPGDTVVEYSVNSKKEFSGHAKFVWVSGSNNYGGFYLPTLQILREGGYEGSRHIYYTDFPGPFAQDIEDVVMNGIRNLVNRVTR